MRDEIEAAAMFITKLVNKANFSQSPSGTTNSSSNRFSTSNTHNNHPTHSSGASSASTSSASSSCSDSHPSLDDATTVGMNDNDQDKLEQFRQCLTNALYERFQHHWFPEQPTKGQAYRCIRLNEWDRHDIALQKACSQCGIDYKDLQLPVELTLWVDPEEVTCRFGETKGSNCLVAHFKDGQLKDKDFNLGI